MGVGFAWLLIVAMAAVAVVGLVRPPRRLLMSSALLAGVAFSAVWLWFHRGDPSAGDRLVRTVPLVAVVAGITALVCDAWRFRTAGRQVPLILLGGAVLASFLTFVPSRTMPGLGFCVAMFAGSIAVERLRPVQRPARDDCPARLVLDDRNRGARAVYFWRNGMKPPTSTVPTDPVSGVVIGCFTVFSPDGCTIWLGAYGGRFSLSSPNKVNLSAPESSIVDESATGDLSRSTYREVRVRVDMPPMTMLQPWGGWWRPRGVRIRAKHASSPEVELIDLLLSLRDPAARATQAAAWSPFVPAATT